VLNQINGLAGTWTFKGDAVSANLFLTNIALSNNGHLFPGQTVTGPGIPAGTLSQAVNISGGVMSLGTSNALTVTQTQGTYTITTPATGTAKFHLYQGAASPGVDPPPTAFTEATFDGYASVLLGGGTGVYSQTNGEAESDYSTGLHWVLTAPPVTPNTVNGYWVDFTDSGGVTRVLCWEAFPRPLPMTAVGNGISLSVPLALPTPAAVSVIG
jgi:hypothetical protein